MTIFVNQYGWPDGAATAQLLCQVLSGAPQGSRLVLLQGRSQYAKATARTASPPAAIVRVWTSSGRRGRSIWKVIGYSLFYLQAMAVLVARPFGSDVVVMTTPPFLSWIAVSSKLLRGGRVISWEMDLYPEILFSTGLLEADRPLGRLVYMCARVVRRAVDLTIVLGPCMEELLRKSGGGRNIVQVQNWADGALLWPVRVPGGDVELRVVYSGNLGVAHDVDTIKECIEILRDSNVVFIFAGGGIKISELRGLRSERIRFQEACEYEELNGVLNSGDIGLVTQTRASLGCVVPSKFYGLLAAGRPVLYIGPRESTVARVIGDAGCGWIIDPGDVNGLVSLLHELDRRRDLVREVGRRARATFDLQFSREDSVRRFWSMLSKEDLR